MFSQLPELGVGLIYSPALEPLFEDGVVDLIEVEPATLGRGSATSYEIDTPVLERLKALPQAKLVHGVGFPVGGLVPPHPRSTTPFIRAIEELGAPWASEHLAFNRVNGSDDFSTGFLLPPLQTVEGVAAAVDNIRESARLLPVPFLVETGVNYLKPRLGELSDGAFTAAVVEAADCGILLDLHNLWANEFNGRQSVEEFLMEIPLERVVEVHLAGGTELDGYWLDAHSGAVPPSLLEAASRILPQLPNVRALIFEVLPTFVPLLGLDGVFRELAKLKVLWDSRRRIGSHGIATKARESKETISEPPASLPEEPSVEAWERTLGSLVVGRNLVESNDLVSSLAADPGVTLLQQLVWRFRAGAISDSCRLTCQLILLYEGEKILSETLDEFFSSCPPATFSSDEGAAFASYLRHIDGFAVPFLVEVVEFELVRLQVLLDGRSRVVSFSADPLPLLQSVSDGVRPENIERGCYELEVTADVPVTDVMRLSSNESAS